MTSLHVDAQAKSLFIEHLEEEGPSLEQLEAYDCLNPGSPGQQPPKRPTLDRRSSLPPPTTSLSSLYSPPQSPRIPLAQASSNVFLPGLVRRLSQVKDKESRRRKERNNNDSAGVREVEEVELALSPRLARAHPSPRPTRRYSSHGTNKSASRDLQGSGFVTRQNLKREIVFSDEKLLDDAKAVLEGLLDEASFGSLGEKRPSSTTPSSSTFIKLNEMPNTSSASSLNDRPSSILLRNPFVPQSTITPQSPASLLSETILRSPVEERRMSFELARAQQAASSASSPIRVLNIPRNSLSSSVTSHNNVRAPSPLGDRAPSRASLDSASVRERPIWAELNLPERRGSAPLVPTVAQLQREVDYDYARQVHHPLSKSVSAAPSLGAASPQSNKKRGSIISLGGGGDKTKEKPERPFYARRSFSASFLNLGKLVTNLAASSSSSSRHATQQPPSTTSAYPADSPSKDRPSTPSFKVNSVTKMESNPFSASAGNYLLGSPSPRTSISGSRPSSPLVTADPVLASDESIEGEVIADTSSDLGHATHSGLSVRNARRLAGVSEDGLLSPSFKVDSRPALSRNARSDDGTPRRAVPAHTNSTLSPSLSSSSSPILNGFHGLRSPARTASPSPNLTKIPEVADENWTASIRGVNPTRGRRMSAADLFAPIQQNVSLPSAPSTLSSAKTMVGREVENNRELDFSKKPISALAGFSSISLDHLPLLPSSSSGSSIAHAGHPAIAVEPRQRATSYSSLLSASRPATPASSPQHKQLSHSINLHLQHSLSKTAASSPRLVGSPSPATRTSRNHRHTQSLPTPVPASSVLDIADVSGRHTSVLEASHAKFVAALTAASATTSPTSGRSSRTPRLSFSAKNRKDIKLALCEAGNEDAIDSSSDEEEEQHIGQDNIRETRGRLPKLSYGGESLTERSDLSSVSPPACSTSLPASAERPQMTPSRPSSSFNGFKQPFCSSPGNRDSSATDGFPSMSGKSRRQDNTSTDSNNTVVSTVHSGDSHKEEDVFSKVAVW